MPQSKEKIVDTVIVGIYDSTMVVSKESGNSDQLIIIQDHKKVTEKGMMDNPWVSSVLIPIIVAGCVALISHRLGKNKRQAEINKLKTETKNIKKSFQPHVLATLQETQKTVLNSKLDALKTLVNLSKNYYHFDQQYYFGEMIFGDQHDYYQHVYSSFGKSGYNEFQKFLADYEYLFPETVIEQFSPIKKAIDKLYDSNKYSDSLKQNMMTEEDEKRIKRLPKEFDTAIQAVRKDLHLDNSFIHSFLEENDIIK